MPRKISDSPRRTSRSIDKSVDQSYDEFQSRFALVTKARANIWLTAAIVLFVIGFLAGIVYLADPNAFLQGSLNSSESKAAFLRGGPINAISQTLRITPPVVSTPTPVVTPPIVTPPNDDGTTPGAFTPTLTVTPRAGQAIANSNMAKTRFDLSWDCHLPENRGEGRLDKKVLNTTAWITNGKVGTFYTEMTGPITTNQDEIIRGSWIALTCTPETGSPVTLRCDVTPASQVGQITETHCRSGSGSIVGCTRNLQTVAVTPTSATIANGSTTSFAVRVTNNDTTACGPSAFTLSHGPNDGTSNLWNFKSLTTSSGGLEPFASIVNPGATATFNVAVSPWDHDPGSLDYFFSSRHSLTTSTQSQYLSCALTANVKSRITVTEGNRQQGTRDISGIHSPGCSNNPTDALNSTGGYYTGPDDGSQDNSSQLTEEAQARDAGLRVRGGVVNAFRNTGIWKIACRAVYGSDSDRCQ